MEWDLFLDESGDFEQNKHCLVGGFICPHGSVDHSKITMWKNSILALPGVQEKISEYGDWFYDHCCENKVTSLFESQKRGEIQLAILREYISRIEEIGGKIVIFDNPKGHYNVDNTTNFLTVLSKGLMMLYYDLCKDNSFIHLFFASRRNNTFCDDNSRIAVSPTRVVDPSLNDNRVIIPEQYKTQIRNLAFLQGGQWLINNRIFSSMIEGIHILNDQYFHNQFGKKEMQANCFTVPCDYICNTLFSAKNVSQEHYEQINALYHSNACYYYYTEKPLQPGFNGLPHWENEKDNGAALLSFMSLDFPEPATSSYFREFNAASIDTQRTIADYVINALRETVNSQRAMEQLAERLEHTIETAKIIQNDEIRNQFIANLLLYQKSLFTHLGDQGKTESITNAFHSIIEKINDDETIDKLIFLAKNRRLVELTDCFDYHTAIQEFEDIERYWREIIELRKRSVSGKRATPCYPVYGRTIGSYLQVLRHLIHLSESEDKELYYSLAEEHFKDGRYHLLDNVDIIRYHETVCDLEAETQRFQSAFDHIYKAATYEEDAAVEKQYAIQITCERGRKIVEAAGEEGEKHPYLMQHYVRLLSQMIIANPNNEESEILLQSLLPFIKPSFGEKINNLHPRTQIRWKTASILAWRNASGSSDRQLASKLYKLAYGELLSMNKPVFSAIAVGVLAEYMQHILLKRITGNESVVYNTLQKAYYSFLEQKTQTEINPFSDLLDENPTCFPSKLSILMCEKLSSRIGY